MRPVGTFFYILSIPSDPGGLGRGQSCPFRVPKNQKPPYFEAISHTPHYRAVSLKVSGARPGKPIQKAKDRRRYRCAASDATGFVSRTLGNWRLGHL
jgi:hypothetical protein